MQVDLFAHDDGMATIGVNRQPKSEHPWKATLVLRDGDSAITVFMTPGFEAELIAALTPPAPAETQAVEPEAADAT